MIETGWPGIAGISFATLSAIFQIETHRARRVAHRRARRQSSKRDDLRDFFLAVFVADVFQNFVAPLVGKVNVDVGRGHAIRVQKPFKQQSIRQRIEVGNSQHVTHQTARRAAATADHDAALFAPVDEVLHHQKIARIALLHDDFLLVGHALFRFVAARMADRIAIIETLLAQVLEKTRQVVAGRHFKMREVRRLQIQFQIDHVGDAKRVFHRFGNVLELFPHLVLRLQIEVRAVMQRVALHRAAGANRDQHFVHMLVFAPQIMRVVRANQRNAGLVMNVDEMRIDFVLTRQIVIHQFEKEVFFAEDVAIFFGAALRFVQFLIHHQLRNLAAQTGAAANDALGILRQQFVINARLVIKAVEIGARRQLHQVFVALEILRPQRQMMRVFLLVQRRIFIGVFAWRDIRLNADNRLDALGFARRIKVDGAVHHAVIGERERRHIHRGGALRQILDAIGAVEQRVLGMHVKMTKTAAAFGHREERPREKNFGEKDLIETTRLKRRQRLKSRLRGLWPEVRLRGLKTRISVRVGGLRALAFQPRLQSPGTQFRIARSAAERASTRACETPRFVANKARATRRATFPQAFPRAPRNCA